MNFWKILATGVKERYHKLKRRTIKQEVAKNSSTSEFLPKYLIMANVWLTAEILKKGKGEGKGKAENRKMNQSQESESESE